MGTNTAPSSSSESYSPDNLLAGDFPRVTGVVTVAAGQSLTRGAVLGKVTVGGKYKLSAAAAGDGSEVPSVVLIDDIDASGGDKKAAVFLTGEFNDAAISLGAGHTASSVRDPLRALSIFLKSVMVA